METTYNEAFAELERRIRRSQTFAICDIINAKAEQYRKVLDNGQEIYLHAVGERYYKIFTLRRHLWSKIFILSDLVGEILDTNK